MKTVSVVPSLLRIRTTHFQTGWQFLTTSMTQKFPWEADSRSADKDVSPFYRTQSFTIKSLFWTLTPVHLIQSTPSRCIYRRSILTDSLKLHAPLLSDLFPWGFPTKVCKDGGHRATVLKVTRLLSGRQRNRGLISGKDKTIFFQGIQTDWGSPSPLLHVHSCPFPRD
jgi:hypothetical protein